MTYGRIENSVSKTHKSYKRNISGHADMYDTNVKRTIVCLCFF